MWYPGLITDKNGPQLVVKFMLRTRTAGTFVWPARDDVQKVLPEFFIACGVVPECVNYGRQWFISDHVKLDELFQMYKNMYFETDL
ncbi:hypothetical protein DPMN_051728 [Dreissena polymorpha]|uniref:Uncharacterized protein n=1 Tax=Dreissena polymorpha TaxID=45954 RepID=A0A9D4HP82_DREPO|nr:hypothetical protein DPMN_051728 [Dreissena polymorpha]